MWSHFIIEITMNFLVDSYMFIAPVCKDWHAFLQKLPSITHPRSVISLNQNKMVLNVNEMWSKSMAKWAAFNGMPDVIIFAHKRNLVFSDSYLSAAERGNLSIIKLLKQLKVHLDIWTAEKMQILFARKGSIEGLQLAFKISRGKHAYHDIECEAAKHNHAHVLSWLYKTRRKICPSSMSLFGALRSKNNVLFKWLLDTYSIRIDSSIIAAAAGNHDIEMLEFVHSKFPLITGSAFRYVLQSPDPQETVFWLYNNGFRPGWPSLIEEVLYWQPLNVLIDLYENPLSRPDIKDNYVVNAIYSFENKFTAPEIINKLNWMWEHNLANTTNSTIYRVMKAAIKSKYVSLVEWVINHNETIVNEDLCLSIRSHVIFTAEIEHFLQENYLIPV
jgi:hypothetical protein